MCFCFETIKVKDGVLKNLEFHQKRVDKTRFELFGFSDKLCLKEEISDIPLNGVYRLRMDYKKKTESTSCKKYNRKNINSFKVVNTNISYDYKYADRRAINDLLVGGYDDVIILKNGSITDTSTANIALHVNGVWLTPIDPLLEGTTRARLLKTGFLKCANLTIKDLIKAENFAIMNSLIGFKIIKDMKIMRDDI